VRSHLYITDLEREELLCG